VTYSNEAKQNVVGRPAAENPSRSTALFSEPVRPVKWLQAPVPGWARITAWRSPELPAPSGGHGSEAGRDGFLLSRWATPRHLFVLISHQPLRPGTFKEITCWQARWKLLRRNLNQVVNKKQTRRHF